MKYYAMIDGERRGPYELENLAEAGVRPSTYVWCKGMDDWEKAEDVADVCRMFRNRIYDLMHPSSVDALRRIDEKPSEPANASDFGMPSRYDRMLGDNGPLPSIEEIDERQDTTTPPSSMLKWAILVTIFCCPPTGIAAIYFALKSKKTWQAANDAQNSNAKSSDAPNSEAGMSPAEMRSLAHDYDSAAKMWTGISLFLGLILYAALLRFL